MRDTSQAAVARPEPWDTPKRWTLDEAVARWLGARHGWSPLTVNRYSVALQRFTQDMGEGAWLDGVTPFDFRDWVDGLRPRRQRRGRTEYSPSALNTTVAPVRAFFGWAIQMRMLAVNPTLEVAPERTEQAPPKRLAKEAVRRLLDAAEPRERVQITLLATYGLRLAELAGLQVQDWDREADLLTVHGKGNKVRILPIVASAGRELTWWVDLYLRAADGPMWPSPRDHGKALGAGWIGRRITAVGEGCRPVIAVHPHLLRHYALASMVEQGYDLALVQFVAGHSSLATTSIYTRAAPEHVRSRLVDGGWGEWL